MEPVYAQLEVLLMTGTTFTSVDLCKKDEDNRNSNSTPNQDLVEACWNGVVQPMLPEIFFQPSNGGVLYLWQVKEGANSLELDLGEVPNDMDSHFSIIPSTFLSTQFYN